VRIIAGACRGRRLAAPRGRGIRPTADRVREAIFDVLGDVGGAQVLDLFAGTGAMGLEALSRGAAWATFVDGGREALDLINRNLAACGFTNAAVVRADPSRGLTRVEALGRRYELVFCDPPYGKGLVPKVLARLAEGALLAEGTFIVAEHGVADDVGEVAGLAATLTLTESRRYGDVQVSFFRRA
jgi:16S rRNA (guanine966-N2)-methyltransferase